MTALEATARRWKSQGSLCTSGKLCSLETHRNHVGIWGGGTVLTHRSGTDRYMLLRMYTRFLTR